MRAARLQSAPAPARAALPPPRAAPPPPRPPQPARRGSSSVRQRSDATLLGRAAPPRLQRRLALLERVPPPAVRLQLLRAARGAAGCERERCGARRRSSGRCCARGCAAPRSAGRPRRRCCLRATRPAREQHDGCGVLVGIPIACHVRVGRCPTERCSSPSAALRPSAVRAPCVRRRQLVAPRRAPPRRPIRRRSQHPPVRQPACLERRPPRARRVRARCMPARDACGLRGAPARPKRAWRARGER